ncbi:MAG: hypothetical protein ACYDH5_17875 [Acidimicrobiales bacterium]
MRTSTTIGFAVDEGDRARLDHLAGVFGGGNRSAFLRAAIRVMEQFDLVQGIGRTQAYGAQRLAEAGRSIDDIEDIVEKALADADPEAIVQAKLIVADLSRRYPAPRRIPAESDEALQSAVNAALQETDGI